MSRQLNLLKYIYNYQLNQAGKSPTLKEIANFCGLSHRSGGNRRVVKLAEAGWLKRPLRQHRKLIITDSGLDLINGAMPPIPAAVRLLHLRAEESGDERVSTALLAAAAEIQVRAAA